MNDFSFLQTLGARYTGQVEEAWIAVCNAFLYVMQPALAESLVEFPWTDPNLLSLDIASPEAAQLVSIPEPSSPSPAFFLGPPKVEDFESLN